MLILRKELIIKLAYYIHLKKIHFTNTNNSPTFKKIIMYAIYNLAFEGPLLNQVLNEIMISRIFWPKRTSFSSCVCTLLGFLLLLFFREKLRYIKPALGVYFMTYMGMKKTKKGWQTSKAKNEDVRLSLVWVGFKVRTSIITRYQNRECRVYYIPFKIFCPSSTWNHIIMHISI